MRIRIANVAQDSIVDGKGMRLAVFTQGCVHACPGCHNPDAHDLEGGVEWDTEDILEMLRKNLLQSGITLTGGEPFLQPAACLALARGAHAMKKDVWTYTGYTFEALVAMEDPDVRALLAESDVLVDGPFVLAERSLEIPFRGSANQRLLDAKASLAAGEAVVYTLPVW